MTPKQEKIEQIRQMLRKAPKSELVASIKTARDFKSLAKKAAACASKSEAYVFDIYQQLKGYYQ